MKNFLTKSEACVALKKIQTQKMVTDKECVELESIRMCIAGEKDGLNLWGKKIEDVRPMFRDCPPSKTEEQKENYEQYLIDRKKAEEIARR